MIREPKSWYASASRHNPGAYGSVGKAIELWLASVEGIEEAKARHGDRVAILSYERLVQDTERQMRTLAEIVGIDFDPRLLEPTFNGLPIPADSSFSTTDYGVIRTALDRTSALDRTVAAQIDRTVAGRYERAIDSAL
jgi:hypothetical protein